MFFQFTYPRHRVTDAAAGKYRQRQRKQMTKQPGAQLNIDATGGVRKNVVTQAAHDDFK